MSTDENKISMDEKSTVLKLFEQFKDNKEGIPAEVKTILTKINDKAWNIKNNDKNPINDRLSAFEVIEKVHTLLNRKFDPNWKPKEKSWGGGPKRIVTAADRKENAEAFRNYLLELKGKNLTFDGPTLQAIATVWSHTT